MKRIGLLGGTFDPPHYGHLLMAEQVYQTLGLDEVWFIPSFKPPHKDDAKSTAKDRVEMTKAAIEDHPAFFVNTIEVDRENKSYTLLTMKELKEQHPADTFYFIIGGDMVEYLPNWHEIDTLMTLTKFVGVNRPDYSLESPYSVQEVNMPLMDISSTMIRKRVKNNESIRYLTPSEVMKIIQEKKLYLGCKKQFPFKKEREKLEQKEALEIVEKQLTKKRYEHTVRVMETALDLANHYGADEKKIETAAIFHDYAKYRPHDELKRWIIAEKLPQDLLEYHPELWHGPVGSKMVEREIGIDDPEIQSAIYWHTTGKRYMSLMDQIIFIADYIEPGRDFPGVDEIRALVYDDIGYACWMAARNTINHLMSKNRSVYPDSFQLYNERLVN